MTRPAAPALLAALVAATGCGGGKPDLAPAGGKLTWKSPHGPKPAAGAFVVLHPKGVDPEKVPERPHATVRDDGTFALTTRLDGDGAAPGEYGVTVQWAGRAGRAVGPGDGEARGGGGDRLGDRYADPRKPRLFVTVEPGRENAFDLSVE